MKKVDWEFVVGAVAFFLFVIVCSVAVIGVTINIARANEAGDEARNICLENGYPAWKYGKNGHWYCIKRTDCQDVVVSVESLKAVK